MPTPIVGADRARYRNPRVLPVIAHTTGGPTNCIHLNWDGLHAASPDCLSTSGAMLRRLGTIVSESYPTTYTTVV